MIVLPSGVIPVEDLTTREVLYGARTTTVRFELLQHSSSTGLDNLVGYLDGVTPEAQLEWVANTSVKKWGTIPVLDLAAAAAGKTRIADINIVTTRIRPVLVIEGLPEIPLGVYVITAAPERWASTGRTFVLEVHEKTVVLDQDQVDATYTAPTGTAILTLVRTMIQSAGEDIAVDASETRTLATPQVWPVNTSKLQIVNDLLSALGYNALWMDGTGAFRATPWIRPALRSIRYSVLNDESGERLARELVDGEESIYEPDWDRDRDVYRVPNKVVAVATGIGAAEPLSDYATNELATSPLSYSARGRWIVETIYVDVPDYSSAGDPTAATKAFLKEKAREYLIAVSAVQAKVTVECLPIPIELLDAIRFASDPAGIDALHTVRTATIPLRFDGRMKLGLQEVIDL